MAKEIELEDKFENMGAQMVKEVASRPPTLPAMAPPLRLCLLSQFSTKGLSQLRWHEPMDLKRGIDKAVAAMVEEVKKLSTPAKTLSQLRRLAPSLPIQTAKSGRSLRTPWTKSAKKE